VPLSVGQQVQRGTVLGLEGTTGSTYSLHGGSGAHVDLRIRDLYGKYVDPHRFI
jgi:murein DD-endopeptidase MepM/ murein hydrolase activator NlpD